MTATNDKMTVLELSSTYFYIGFTMKQICRNSKFKNYNLFGQFCLDKTNYSLKKIDTFMHLMYEAQYGSQKHSFLKKQFNRYLYIDNIYL